MCVRCMYKCVCVCVCHIIEAVSGRERMCVCSVSVCVLGVCMSE